MFDAAARSGRDDDLLLAHELADAADLISVRHFRRSDLDAITKADGSPVTAADRLVEAALRDALRRRRPDDVIVGEELGTDGQGGRRWFIDPIDGTSGFLAGKPDWRTLVAVEVGGIVQAGVASSPGIDRRWWAARGSGAWTRRCGGQSRDQGVPPVELAVSRTRQLSRATLASWPPVTAMPATLRAPMARLAAASRPAPPPDPTGTRHGALLVATGRTDAFLFAGAGPWDLAAMVSIVEEAGGRFSDMTGGRSLHSGTAIFSNGLLHNQILECLGGAA